MNKRLISFHIAESGCKLDLNGLVPTKPADVIPLLIQLFNEGNQQRVIENIFFVDSQSGTKLPPNELFNKISTKVFVYCWKSVLNKNICTPSLNALMMNIQRKLEQFKGTQVTTTLTSQPEIHKALESDQNYKNLLLLMNHAYAHLQKSQLQSEHLQSIQTYQQALTDQMASQNESLALLLTNQKAHYSDELKRVQDHIGKQLQNQEELLSKFDFDLPRLSKIKLETGQSVSEKVDLSRYTEKGDSIRRKLSISKSKCMELVKELERSLENIKNKALQAQKAQLAQKVDDDNQLKEEVQRLLAKISELFKNTEEVVANSIPKQLGMKVVIKQRTELQNIWDEIIQFSNRLEQIIEHFMMKTNKIEAQQAIQWKIVTSNFKDSDDITTFWTESLIKISQLLKEDSQDSLFLSFPSMFPESYKKSLVEMRRRDMFNRFINYFGDRFKQVGQEERQKRREFQKIYAVYIPKTVTPELNETQPDIMYTGLQQVSAQLSKEESALLGAWFIKLFPELEIPNLAAPVKQKPDEIQQQQLIQQLTDQNKELERQNTDLVTQVKRLDISLNAATTELDVKKNLSKRYFTELQDLESALKSSFDKVQQFQQSNNGSPPKAQSNSPKEQLQYILEQATLEREKERKSKQELLEKRSQQILGHEQDFDQALTQLENKNSIISETLEQMTNLLQVYDDQKYTSIYLQQKLKNSASELGQMYSAENEENDQKLINAALEEFRTIVNDLLTQKLDISREVEKLQKSSIRIDLLELLSQDWSQCISIKNDIVEGDQIIFRKLEGTNKFIASNSSERVYELDGGQAKRILELEDYPCEYIIGKVFHIEKDNDASIFRCQIDIAFNY